MAYKGLPQVSEIMLHFNTGRTASSIGKIVSALLCFEIIVKVLAKEILIRNLFKNKFYTMSLAKILNQKLYY